MRGAGVKGHIFLKTGDVVLPKIMMNSSIVVNSKDIIAGSVTSGSIMTKGPTEIISAVDRCVSGYRRHGVLCAPSRGFVSLVAENRVVARRQRGRLESAVCARLG